VQAVNQAVATRAGLDPTTLRLATR
jgi:hypothetical protein